MRFSRQELEWLPFPSAGDLPDPGIETTSPELAGGFFTFLDFFWWCLLQSVFENFLSSWQLSCWLSSFCVLLEKKDYSYTEIWRDYFESPCTCYLGIFMMVQQVKNPLAMQETQETQVQSLVWKAPLEEENGNPLQYSCLKIPMDRGACWATVHKVSNSWTQLSTHALIL